MTNKARRVLLFKWQWHIQDAASLPGVIYQVYLTKMSGIPVVETLSPTFMSEAKLLSQIHRGPPKCLGPIR